MNFKIKRGHVIGFLATVFVFGMVFLYIYNGTKEVTWVYSIENHTKEKLGKNIYNVIYSQDEKYIAWITYNGIAHVAQINEIKNIIYSQKEINKIFFFGDNLLMVDKSGSLSSYDCQNKETTNYDTDCFNKNVFVSGEMFYIVEDGLISYMDMSEKDPQITEVKRNINISSPDNIFVDNMSVAVFDENSVKIYQYPTFEEKIIPLNKYRGRGTVCRNDDEEVLIVYINKEGDVVINKKGQENVLSHTTYPHSIVFSNAYKCIICADKTKTYCYNNFGETEWNKDIMSDMLTVSPIGNYCISIYSKAKACVYSVDSGEEQYSLGNLKKAEFSPSEKYITATQKSMY